VRSQAHVAAKHEIRLGSQALESRVGFGLVWVGEWVGG
jgi:hypothetical protein